MCLLRTGPYLKLMWFFCLGQDWTGFFTLEDHQDSELMSRLYRSVRTNLVIALPTFCIGKTVTCDLCFVPADIQVMLDMHLQFGRKMLTCSFNKEILVNWQFTSDWCLHLFPLQWPVCWDSMALYLSWPTSTYIFLCYSAVG